MDDTIREFLSESNKIEQEYGEQALSDAIDAWKYFTGDNKSMFSYPSFMHTHYLLMKNLNIDIAGEITDIDVWIGGNRKRFISKALIQNDLEEVANRINGTIADKGCEIVKESVVERATKKLHVQFERIHPFADGNGRTGRIIYNAHRLKLGLPIHVIHEGDEQCRYYGWFRGDIT